MGWGMTRWGSRMVVIGRLQAKPLLAGQLLCALAVVGLVARQARGADMAEVAANLLFGNLVVTAAVAAAIFGFVGYFRAWRRRDAWRSEEHTSELQSLMRISYAVFCLKKKK